MADIDHHAWVENEFIRKAAWGVLPTEGAAIIRAKVHLVLEEKLAAREQSLQMTGEALETIDAARASIERYWGANSSEKIAMAVVEPVTVQKLKDRFFLDVTGLEQDLNETVHEVFDLNGVGDTWSRLVVMGTHPGVSGDILTMMIAGDEHIQVLQDELGIVFQS